MSVSPRNSIACAAYIILTSCWWWTPSTLADIRASACSGALSFVYTKMHEDVVYIHTPISRNIAATGLVKTYGADDRLNMNSYASAAITNLRYGIVKTCMHLSRLNRPLALLSLSGYTWIPSILKWQGRFLVSDLRLFGGPGMGWSRNFPRSIAIYRLFCGRLQPPLRSDCLGLHCRVGQVMEGLAP